MDYISESALKLDKKFVFHKLYSLLLALWTHFDSIFFRTKGNKLSQLISMFLKNASQDFTNALTLPFMVFSTLNDMLNMLHQDEQNRFPYVALSCKERSD